MTEARPKWRTILAVAVALLAAGIALGQLQGLLQGMHLSGRPGASIGSLNHLFHWGADVKVSSNAVRVWKEYSDATASPGIADGLEVAWWAVLVDALLFAPLYALGLFLFFLRAHRQLGRWLADRTTPDAVKTRLQDAGQVTKATSVTARKQGQDALRRYILTAKIGIGLIVAAFVADEVENYANIQIVKAGWHDKPDAGRLESLTWLLWTAGWAKWVLALSAVAVALALAWVVLAESFGAIGAGWSALKPRLHLLRVQVGLAALVAFLPFAHEQLADMIRRWTVLQLALAGIAVWTFALSTWLVGRRLLCNPAWKPRWDRAKRAPLLFWTLIALAVVQVALHIAFRGNYRIGWGLAVPASIMAALALLGWLLPDAVAEDEEAPAQALSPNDPSPGLPRALAALAMTGFGLSVLHASFGYSVYAQAWSWDATRLVALGLVLAGAVIAVPAGRDPLVGGVVGAVAGIVLLAVAQSGELAPSILVVAGLLLVLAGWRLYGALNKSWLPDITTGRMLVLGAVFAACYAGIVIWPLEAGAALGGVGILLAFMTLLAWVGALVVWATPAIPVPQALRAARISRFPIVALLIVWFLAASWFDGGAYHNVRLKDAQAAAQGTNLDSAFACWLRKNGLKQDGCRLDTRATGKQGKATPLIFVATTGGGIRAAYWTSLVLDCAFEAAKAPDACPNGEHVADLAKSDRLFALSGISGGSLGLAAYAAYLAQKQAGPPEPGWVAKRLGGDALSGSGAWWLFVEIPRVFLQFRSPTDRAAILERGWEKEWPNGELGKGLLELWRTDRHTPLLLLNGTSVEDGCRFETSPLDANVETNGGTPPGCKSTEPFDSGHGLPGTNVAHRSTLPATRDLVDLLCHDTKDVRLSTAALLSARFPFVNPSARVEGRCKKYTTTKPVAYVVDGGYLDTSGASPVVELMSRLQPLVDRWNKDHPKRCVAPVMIQIDNGFSAGIAGTARRTGELLVPLKTVFATRGAREAESRISAALLFSGHQPTRWAHFVNEAHPGPKAPLGWTQSQVSERELTSQLTQERNRDAFKTVRKWLSGDIACPATP